MPIIGVIVLKVLHRLWSLIPGLMMSLWLAASTDCDPKCWLPLPWGVQSSQAMCSSRLSVQVRPFRDTTPVKVAAALQGELREEGTRRLRVFHYQHCTANMQILKYVYVPQLSCWVIFFPSYIED